MLTFESILPSNSTPLERALERASAFPDLPIDALGDLTNAEAIDSRFLPWLAYRFATDIWLDEWDEEKRRDVIRQQFELHRLKGTEEGIRRMLALVDARVVQSVTYPQRAFAGRAINKAERDEWLARMPQIRVYLVNERGTAGADAFVGADGRGHGAFAGHMFVRLDRAEAIYGRRAVLRNPDGSETPLRRATIVEDVETRQGFELDRVSIPGEAGPALFAGGFVGHGFVTRKNKPARVITYQLNREYDSRTSELHLDTIIPGLDPVDVKYERVSDRAPAGLAQFVGARAGVLSIARRFLSEDRAKWRLYDRVYLHDDTVDAPWVRSHSFAGHARLGMKPYHAEMLVEARSARQRRATYANRIYAGGTFAVSENLNRLRWVYAAIRRSKAARDRILIDTQTLRPWRWGDGIPMDGSFRFGQRVRSRL